MKIMTSRFAGTCRGCKSSIRKGEQIGYAGKGQGAYHMGCVSDHVSTSVDRVFYGYTSNGRNRCEDAPCCGCCD